MLRVMAILLWMVFSFIASAFFFGAIIAFFYLRDPDPPTHIAFVGTMCFSPVLAIIALVLGITGKLPGTGKQTD
jgi:hypothetical protein